MKSWIKWLANVTATILVLPAFVLYQIGRSVLGAQLSFSGWSQAFSLIPGITGVYLRRAFYRLVLARCSDDAHLGFGSVFSHPTTTIGRGAYVGVFCCLGDVSLGDDVLVGSHVAIANGGRQHGIERLDVPIREQPGQWPRITIGRDSWIGDRAVVMADVGKQCVIGAGSVVTRAMPDRAIAVGVPARVIRYREAHVADAEENAARVGKAIPAPAVSCLGSPPPEAPKHRTELTRSAHEPGGPGPRPVATQRG
jgi:acetyltransferase-like isoleucine patch superfamily enzyme